MKCFPMTSLRDAFAASRIRILQAASRLLLSGEEQERLATALLELRPILYTIWYPNDVRRIAQECLSEELVAELDDAFCLDLLAGASYDDALTERDIASFLAEFIEDSASIAWVRETIFRK